MADWRKRYINILQNGPVKEDYDLAAELIEAGYAKGNVLPNHMDPGSRVAALVWKGPTTNDASGQERFAS